MGNVPDGGARMGAVLQPELVPELVPGYGWVVWPVSQLDESARRWCAATVPRRRARHRRRHRLGLGRPFPLRRVVVTVLLLFCVVVLFVPLPR